MEPDRTVLVYLWDDVPGCPACARGETGACAFVNGHDLDFARSLADLVDEYGPPSRVEASSIPWRG